MPLYFSGECRQLFFRADFTFGNRRLIKHVIESVKVRDFDLCELRCYQQPDCVSINFNVIPHSNGSHECELNNATHRSHDRDLENIDGYIYKGTEVRTLNCCHLSQFSEILVAFGLILELQFKFDSCSSSD